MVRHPRDDYAKIEINLDAGCVYVDDDPSLVWHVPLASQQTQPGRARIVACLLAREAHELSALNVEQLEAALNAQRNAST